MPVILWLWWLIEYGQSLCQRFVRLLSRWFPNRTTQFGRKKKLNQANEEETPVYYPRQLKPEWVKQEVIRLKALMPKT